eukprot:4194540-Prymnesium_polylepis.1
MLHLPVGICETLHVVVALLEAQPEMAVAIEVVEHALGGLVQLGRGASHGAAEHPDRIGNVGARV